MLGKLIRISIYIVIMSQAHVGGALSAEKKSNAPLLSGTLLIQWSNETSFIYTPDSNDPLIFRTRDSREIRPGRMYTDGGSIPRIFWAVKGFSPWGYGPAYLLHDWLFHQHRCGYDTAPNTYTMLQANEVLDDAIQLLMASKKVLENHTARRLIKWAIDKYGSAAWNEPCDAEPSVSADGLRSRRLNVPLLTVGTITIKN